MGQNHASMQMQTRKDLSNTNSHVQALNGELGTTCDGVAKIASGLDVANEYLHGLSSGFQDAHRCVMDGQDGLLPPISDKREVLPKLSPRPRPVTASLRGRCVVPPSR